jgi:hypothetical protein
MNDVSPIYSSGSTYAALTIANTGTGVSATNSNSLYTSSDFRRSTATTYSTSTATAARRFRLVSCRLKVTSLASSTANPGEMIGVVTPTHESMVGMSFDNISSFPGHARIIGERGNSIELYYTPVWKSEYEYHNIVDTNVYPAGQEKAAARFILDTSAIQENPQAAYGQYNSTSPGLANETNAYQPFMGVVLGGADEVPFMVEIDANYEVIGLNVGQLASPSLFNPLALDGAKKATAVLPKAGATNKGEKSLGEKIVAQLPKVMKFVENALVDALPAPIRVGYDFIRDLF